MRSTARIAAAFCMLPMIALPARSVAQQATPLSKYPVQEGFPADAIRRLQNRGSSLRQRLGAADVARAQSVIRTSQTWSLSEMPLKVAFLGGSDDLRAKIIATASQWAQSTGVRFDFGEPGNYREWTRRDQTYQAMIRISFDESGYWSWVGAQSLDPSLSAPSQSSMNLRGFDTDLPDGWQGVVLHEFGHAIGLEHEHQNPSAGCDRQFHWDDDSRYVSQTDMYGQFVPDPAGRRPGIYTVMNGPPNRWPKSQVDFNLKSLPATTDLAYSVFDPASVMMYSFPRWMFVDGASITCQVQPSLVLSQQDLIAVQSTYRFTLSSSPNVVPHANAVSQLDVARQLLKKKLPDEVKEFLRGRMAAME